MGFLKDLFKIKVPAPRAPGNDYRFLSVGENIYDGDEEWALNYPYNGNYSWRPARIDRGDEKVNEFHIAVRRRKNVILYRHIKSGKIYYVDDYVTGKSSDLSEYNIDEEAIVIYMRASVYGNEKFARVEKEFLKSFEKV